MENKILTEVMQLIPALQMARKFWLEPKTPDLQERRAWLERLTSSWLENLNHLSAEKINAMAAEAGLSPELYKAWDIEGSCQFMKKFLLAQSADKDAHGEYFGRGVLVLMQSQLHPLRLVIERLMPGLLAGNSLIVKFSSQTPLAAEFLLERLQKAGVPEAVVRVVVSSAADVNQILSSHPAVAGVSVVGSPADAEAVLQNGLSLKKVFQAWTGGRTSLLALEPLTTEEWKPHLRSYTDGNRLMRPYDVSRIFILEAQEEAGKMALTQIISEAAWIEGFTAEEGKAYQAMVQRMRTEEGRVIAGGDCEIVGDGARLKPTLVLHLPQCSEYHQEDQIFPLLLLSTVKYAFDAAKWVNNSSRGFALQILGPDEKAEKLAPKFEVARVFGQRSFDPTESLLFGLKESAAWLADLNYKGLFFSQERIVNWQKT